MKKLLFVMLAALTLASCQKKENESAPQFQDVSFKALEITPNTGLKSTADWECKDIIPSHAWVVINGEDYYPELFEVEGVLYTQALKLPVPENNAEYCASAFVLYLEGNGTPGYQADPAGDEIVSGTPQPGSDYETYINADYRFDYCFTVDAFAKAELPIEVLCYQNADYSEFGFNWFAITEIVIREQCFFGDFCITNPADYNDSNYGLQSTWPSEEVTFIDAPAIVSLNVFKNTQAGWVEVANSPFTNNTADAAYGVGSPVCVQYPDNLSIDGEEFKVVLNILIQQGTAYEMVEFHTWFFNDDEMIVEAPPVSDGVVDFVLGTCNLSDTDLQLSLDDVTYNSINIGAQEWMTQNLDVAFYRNGDPISHATTNAEWVAAGTAGIGAWCYYNNDPANGPIYGKLYNWYAVNDTRGLAPDGWHIPNDAEWTTLETFLGGTTLAGGEMKETGTTHWSPTNIGATNSSGFTGLPGGVRANSGPYSFIGNQGYWWGATESFIVDGVWCHIMGNGHTYLFRNNFTKDNGMSVRCVKD